MRGSRASRCEGWRSYSRKAPNTVIANSVPAFGPTLMMMNENGTMVGCYSLTKVHFLPRSVSDEAIQSCFVAKVDCFASLAMMGWTAPDGIDVPDWRY